MKLEIIQGHQKRNWRDDKHNEKNTYQLFLFQLILTEWSSSQKVVHLKVWEIDPIQLLKGGIKWPREDTSWRKMTQTYTG